MLATPDAIDVEDILGHSGPRRRPGQRQLVPPGASRPVCRRGGIRPGGLSKHAGKVPAFYLKQRVDAERPRVHFLACPTEELAEERTAARLTGGNQLMPNERAPICTGFSDYKCSSSNLEKTTSVCLDGRDLSRRGLLGAGGYRYESGS